MSWNDAFNSQLDLFDNNSITIGGSNTITLNTNTGLCPPSWTNYGHNYNTAPYNVKTQLNTYIQVGEERIDERMLKRWRIFWEMMENDPKFADVIKDIETQIAFEALGEENDK